MGRRWEVEGDQEKVEIGEDGEMVVGKVRDRQRLSLVDFLCQQPGCRLLEFI